jgi:prevent-host-death family protein
MDEIVTAVEVNRRVSELLRAAREGRSFVVTSHGKPIARILPVGRSPGDGRSQAKAELMRRLREQPIQPIGRWTRDELYEDDP